MTDDIAGQSTSLRDLRFIPDLRPASPKSIALVDEIVARVERHEIRKGLRKRKRKAKDQSIFQQTVAAVLSNAIRAWFIDPEIGVSVSLSKAHLGRRSRYGSPVMSKTLPDILRRLATQEVWALELQLGHLGYFSQPRLTTFKIGPTLYDLILSHDLDPRDIQSSSEQEVIILKKAKQGHWDQGELIEYRDDSRTNALRDEVRRINQWLERADIKFYGLTTSGKKVDTTDRLMRRYFNNGSFGQGGRLFGGFWQSLSKSQRSQGLRINGEQAVTLDFGQMAPRLLYGKVGVQPVQEDAYLVPGLEHHRIGVKKVFNAILFADKPLTRLPQGTRSLLPKWAGMADVLKLLAQVHAPIKDFFFTGVGYELQFRESEVLIDVLLDLQDRGLVGLPIHDAVVVPRSTSLEAKAIMLRVFSDHSGIEGIVEEEG